MPVSEEPVCDRCGADDIRANYHDGTWFSSLNNKRDIFGHNDLIAFCDPCYQELHRGMKAWVRGAVIQVKKPTEVAS